MAINETTSSERSGEFSGNSSSEGLFDDSHARLSHELVASRQDAAKIKKNTATAKYIARKILSEGGLKNYRTAIFSTKTAYK